jgi:uncharacterized OB-fold protein
MTEPESTFTGPGPTQIHRQALAAGEFRIQHCTSCGRHQFYPRSLCKYCGGTDLHWVTASGRGTVYSTSVVRQKPETGPDYNVALVDLEEGVRMLTRVVEIAPEAVRIGMPVQGFVGEIDGERAYLFRPAGGQT